MCIESHTVIEVMMSQFPSHLSRPCSLDKSPSSLSTLQTTIEEQDIHPAAVAKMLQFRILKLQPRSNKG